MPWRASSEKHPLRPRCLGGLLYWLGADRKMATRITRLIGEIQRDPFTGIGKPEPLKGDLSGYLSRRIDDKHRLIYRADDKEVKILKARYHYSD
jgi:toxin YoeB